MPTPIAVKISSFTAAISAAVYRYAIAISNTGLFSEESVMARHRSLRVAEMGFNLFAEFQALFQMRCNAGKIGKFMRAWRCDDFEMPGLTRRHAPALKSTLT